MKDLSHLILPDSLSVNYNFGPTVTLYEGFNTDYMFPNGTYSVILKHGNLIFDQYYLKPGHWFKHFTGYYLPIDIELYGLRGKEMVLLHTHKFDLTGKNVLFELYPEDETESKIWLNYLTIFQSKTKCNVFVKSILDTPHGFNSFTPEDLFYASYKVNRDENIHVNPYGIDSNSFDHINNKLLRV